MSFLRKTHIENAKKKEANNQDEISKKKTLRSQRTEENGQYMQFSSLQYSKIHVLPYVRQRQEFFYL